MSKRIKVSKRADSKRIEIEKKKWRGNFVKNRKIRIFYISLANWVNHDSMKAGLFRKFLIPTKVGNPQTLSNQCSELEPIRRYCCVR